MSEPISKKKESSSYALIVAIVLPSFILIIDILGYDKYKTYFHLDIISLEDFFFRIPFYIIFGVITYVVVYLWKVKSKS